MRRIAGRYVVGLTLLAAPGLPVGAAQSSDLGTAPAVGSEDAPVTILEYTDFQCPYCAEAHRTVQWLLEKYSGRIRLEFKNLPLTIHSWARDAAVAAVCVNAQNGPAFWKLTDLLFDSQRTITKEALPATVTRFAEEAGLDVGKLEQCIGGQAALEAVKSDMDEAKDLGILVAPAFMINNRPVDGAKDAEYFSRLIDDALASGD
jgi:protein-disulfide isomerase